MGSVHTMLNDESDERVLVHSLPSDWFKQTSR